VERSAERPLVRVGRIGRVHGVHGELALEGSPLSAAELEVVRVFTWRGSRGQSLSLRLERVRPVHLGVLVTFEGYADRDRALELVRGELLAEADRLPDPGPGVVYTFQLIGLSVRTEEGRVLGTVADVIATGAHPVYVVRGERELLVPASREVLKRVDLAAGVITVSLPAGLEDL
jgi:16S rRNA processing protein RimM